MFGIKKALKEKYYKIRFRMDSSDINIMNLRNSGCTIGDNCRVFTSFFSKEPSLISVGDGTTISTNVTFCTHDNSVIKMNVPGTDIYGRIDIGDNCFIGMNSLLMYGIEIGDNAIVAAGSVVTKSVPAGTVWGGNPAKYICDVESFRTKIYDNAISIDVSEVESFFKENPHKLVRR